VVGFSLLSSTQTTYSGFYFVTLKPWGDRDPEGLTADVIMQRLNAACASCPRRSRFAFPPPAIPGIGTVGRRHVRARGPLGGQRRVPRQNTAKFIAAASKRPEFASIFTTFVPSVPQSTRTWTARRCSSRASS
jgi:HAE1 family hydrophobic/amphiphilic exporter-1